MQRNDVTTRGPAPRLPCSGHGHPLPAGVSGWKCGEWGLSSQWPEGRAHGWPLHFPRGARTAQRRCRQRSAPCAVGGPVGGGRGPTSLRGPWGRCSERPRVSVCVRAPGGRREGCRRRARVRSACAGDTRRCPRTPASLSAVSAPRGQLDVGRGKFQKQARDTFTWPAWPARNAIHPLVPRLHAVDTPRPPVGHLTPPTCPSVTWQPPRLPTRSAAAVSPSSRSGHPPFAPPRPKHEGRDAGDVDVPPRSRPLRPGRDERVCTGVGKATARTGPPRPSRVRGPARRPRAGGASARSTPRPCPPRGHLAGPDPRSVPALTPDAAIVLLGAFHEIGAQWEVSGGGCLHGVPDQLLGGLGMCTPRTRGDHGSQLLRLCRGGSWW